RERSAQEEGKWLVRGRGAGRHAEGDRGWLEPRVHQGLAGPAAGGAAATERRADPDQHAGRDSRADQGRGRVGRPADQVARDGAELTLPDGGAIAARPSMSELADHMVALAMAQ